MPTKDLRLLPLMRSPFDMVDQPRKISNDPDLTLPYPPRCGRCREKDGRPRNGVYRQNFRKTVTKSYIRGGTLLARYRYPRITPSFHSPLVNDYNQNLSGGWYWQYREDGTLRRKGEFNNEVIFQRLAEGRKPLGGLRFFDDDKEKLGQFLERLFQSPLAFSFRREGHEFLVTVCRPGRLGELFDFGCLMEDYAAMNAAAKVKALGSLPDLKRFLFSLKNDCLERYLEFDHRHVSGTFDTILAGLLLGYPIENTFSLLLENGSQAS